MNTKRIGPRQATPRPWAYDEDRVAIIAPDVPQWEDDPDAPPVSVVSLYAAMSGNNTTADRELILRAVNAHDALVAALELLVEWAEGQHGDPGGIGGKSLDEARAALALARGEE